MVQMSAPEWIDHRLQTAERALHDAMECAESLGGHDQLAEDVYLVHHAVGEVRQRLSRRRYRASAQLVMPIL